MITFADLPAREYLQECFEYREASGLLIWKRRPASHYRDAGHSAEHMAARCNSQFAGRPALNAIKNNGYRMGALDRIGRTAHRVVWKLITGEDPELIDHINGVKTDNRICNLRNVDRRANSQNRTASRLSSTGIRGVYKHSQSGGWLSHISGNDGKLVSKYSMDIDEVTAWRKAMEIEFGYLTRGVE